MIDHRVTLVTLLLLVLVSLSAPAVSQTGAGDATVQNATYAGEAAVEMDAEETLIWRDGPHQFVVTISSKSGLDSGSLCLWTDPGDETPESELACKSVSVAAESSASVTLEFDAWPSTLTGNHSVRTAVRSADDERVLDEFSVDLTVLERDGDVDEDGLANERETSLGTKLRGNDTDGDGLEDGVEVHAYDTDPKSNDTDGDGLLDRAEIESHQTDPTAADTDGDGLPDGVEVSNDTSANVADTDGDGLDDALELNTYETNATLPDTDGDGLDDGSEVRDHGTNPTQSDTDGDGLQDNLEIHTYETDPNAIDTDGDGLQDGVEVAQHRTDPTAADTDGDGLLDGAEVNTHQTNPTKADTDGDGLDDSAEVNRFETDPLSSDTDGDGVSDPQEVDRSQFGSPSLLRRLAVVGVLVVVLLGAGIYRRDGPVIASVHRALFAPVSGSVGGGSDDSGSTAETDAGEPGSESGPDPARPDLDSGSDSTANGDAATQADPSDDGPATAEAEDEPEEVDLALLPNSECILAVLDENGGQIRQSKLVEETGWSKAKVSRVLSKMEADDEIVKVSVGRGNLITTPNDVPSGVRSPFED